MILVDGALVWIDFATQITTETSAATATDDGNRVQDIKTLLKSILGEEEEESDVDIGFNITAASLADSSFLLRVGERLASKP